MRYQRPEFVLRADHLQLFDNFVAQLCELYPDAALFQDLHQSTQYHPRGNVDVRHAGKIEDNGPNLRRGSIDQIEDAAADMLRVEVEPCARAAHDQRTRRIARSRI